MSNSKEKSKKSVNNDKLTMSFLYQKCNHDEENGITDILDKTKITSNLKNYLKYNKYKFIVFMIILATLTIIAFRDTPILILYAFILFLIIAVMGVISSTYTIKLLEDGVKVKYKFQDYVINYEKLVNIYMSKSKIGFVLNAYFINIIYIENEKTVMKFTLPLMMVNRRELKDFFSKIKVESIEDADPLDPDEKPKKKKEEIKDEEILQQEKMKKVLSLFLVGCVVIIVLVVGVVAAIALR